jgi:hypothetical protein
VIRAARPLLGAMAAITLLSAGTPARAQWPLPFPVPQPPAQPPQGFPPQLPQILPPPLFGPAPQLPQVIAPPTPVPGARETEQRLDLARAVDSRRKLTWVRVDARGGFEMLGLTTFSGGDALTGGVVKTSTPGGLISVGAGARLLFFTFLLRGALGVGGAGQMWRVGPEIGFHVPLGNVEPHLEIGGGYAAFGHVADQAGGVAGKLLSLRGGYGRVGAGVDYYLVPAVSIGGALSAELLGLKRPALTAAQVDAVTQAAPAGSTPSLLAQSGSSVGGALSLALVLGLHF